MIDTIDLSKVSAQRIRALRIESGLSHVELCNELRSQYGIEISRDSLMNYEVSDVYHTKFGKNMGMRIEYLLCLADYYHVSTDYLLGLSNEKSPDSSIQAIRKGTGLSGESIVKIADLTHNSIDILNEIISHPAFDEIMITVERAYDMWREYTKHESEIYQATKNADGELIAAVDYLRENFYASVPFDEACELYIENAKSIFGSIIEGIVFPGGNIRRYDVTFLDDYYRAMLSSADEKIQAVVKKSFQHFHDLIAPEGGDTNA